MTGVCFSPGRQFIACRAGNPLSGPAFNPKMTPDQFPPNPPTSPQTWKQFFTSPAFVKDASIVIMLAISVATTQLTSCNTNAIRKTQDAAAPAVAQSNINTAELAANLKGNTPEATAKVDEAVKVAAQVKATTQESK